MPFETLLLERGDGHAVVTLNRPPANTISQKLVLELDAAVDELARDDDVRAIVLTGAGDRIFCGGADLSGAFSGGPEELEAFIRRGQTVLRRIERLPEARHRGDPGPCDGRRLRARHGVSSAGLEGDGADRPNRVEPRHHPGIRGHPAACPGSSAGRRRWSSSSWAP